MNKNMMLEQIANNPLAYRSILTIPQNVKIGIEVEVENINVQKLYKLIHSQFGEEWFIKTDLSLNYNDGNEIVPPILYNTKETWILLKKLGKLLTKFDATFENCSFQINYDMNLLKNTRNKVKLLKLFAMYEDIIFRFSKGLDDKYRESMEIYSAPLILVLKDYITHYDNEYLIDKFTKQKRYAIDFKPQGLIEIRTPNGTNSPILWQNYITFFYYLIMYATDSKCNEEELDNYILNFNKTYILQNYELLKIDKAMELADKIYKKSIDKSYFLEQYIGKDMDAVKSS